MTEISKNKKLTEMTELYYSTWTCNKLDEDFIMGFSI